MNFSKHIFTKEEFLALPVYETKAEAPKDKSPFLFGKAQVAQKEQLLEFIEKVSKNNAEERKTISKMGSLKVLFTIRHKDGNISDVGGEILMKELVESLASLTDDVIGQLKEAGPVEKPKKSDAPFVIDVPDLTFSANAS